MSRRSITFLVLLLVVLLICFGIHIGILYLLNLDLFHHKIILSYSVNFAMAMIILIFIERSLLKKSSYSGFIFMAGSGLKFLVFFLLFYPAYKSDGIMETAEFTSFFVPYVVCLTLEVIYLSKQLNNQTF